MHDDPFGPPSPQQLARSAATSAVSAVQCSLYANLKWRYPEKSGAVAWYLIRLTQPSHADHAKARWAIAQRDPKDLLILTDAVRKTKASPKGQSSGWQGVCDQILAALSDLSRAALAPALAALHDVKPAPPGSTCIRDQQGRTQVIRDEFLESFLTSGWVKA